MRQKNTLLYREYIFTRVEKLIQLNVDFNLLSKYFGITTQKIQQYANKDIDEIMELEAAQGNTKARDYKKILSDPDKLLEIFKLTNVENKLAILQNMSEGDLDDLLPFLEQDAFVQGLYFFSEEKLLAMCQDLPKEELIGIVFEKFDTFDVLSLMQENSMDNFLMEPKAERKYAQHYFETLNQKALEQIMVSKFGEDYRDKSRKEYLQEFENMEDNEFNQFLISMDRNSKINLIGNMVSQEEDLLLLFENEDIAKPMELLMKDDKIKLMSNLDPEFLIPMMQELPVDLTQIVLTQIDPAIFAETLARDFQDILQSVVLFSNRGV